MAAPVAPPSDHWQHIAAGSASPRRRITPEIQTVLDLPNTSGALVGSIAPNSPATGKLHPGDVLAALAGVPITDPQSLLIRTAELPAGTQASVKFWRDGGEHSTTLLITAPPPPLDETIAPPTPPAPSTITLASLGLSISTTPAATGVTITAVTTNGPAASAGILAGNLIEQIGGQPATVSTLPSQIKSLAQSHQPAILLISGDTASGTNPGPRWVPVATSGTGG